MKVIFLDIDGVLNNEEFTLLLHKRLLGREQYLQVFRDIGEMPFDYRSCVLLQKLIHETGAEVVLSSIWRLSDKHVEGIKKYAGIEIKDKTPRLSCSRGIEIDTYLNVHPEVTNYVILDDDTDMLSEQSTHFVQCDAKAGFTYKEYEKAKDILKSEE